MCEKKYDCLRKESIKKVLDDMYMEGMEIERIDMKEFGYE